MLFNKRLRTLHSSKQLQKKRKKNIVFTSVVSASILIFLILIILLLRSHFLQITLIEVKGTTALNAIELEQKTLTSLNGKYFYLIPKSNAFFYPKSLLEKDLVDSYKRIESVEIHRKNFSTLTVSIVEKKPTVLVCEGFHEENGQDENCFFTDEQGYVFAKAPQFSNGVYLRYYIVSDAGDSIIGTKFIDKDLFNNLQKFAEVVEKANIDPSGILIGSQGDYEMYSKNIDGSEMIIYFSDRSPFEKTATNLVAFWNDSKIKKKGATTTPIFDSINLRFGNNVFYVNK